MNVCLRACKVFDDLENERDGTGIDLADYSYNFNDNRIYRGVRSLEFYKKTTNVAYGGYTFDSLSISGIKRVSVLSFATQHKLKLSVNGSPTWSADCNGTKINQWERLEIEVPEGAIIEEIALKMQEEFSQYERAYWRDIILITEDGFQFPYGVNRFKRMSNLRYNVSVIPNRYGGIFQQTGYSPESFTIDFDIIETDTSNYADMLRNLKSKSRNNPFYYSDDIRREWYPIRITSIEPIPVPGAPRHTKYRLDAVEYTEVDK